MKDIKNYEGLYAVTEDGRVWSYRNNKWLKPLDSRGYVHVQLSKNGNRVNYLVHRLVAEAYLPNPNNLPHVNHKDEKKLNNSVDNLEWCTEAYNNSYGTHLARLRKPVHCIELDKTFSSLYEAAKAVNIAYCGISNCLSGRRQTAGGYHWRYINE